MTLPSYRTSTYLLLTLLAALGCEDEVAYGARALFDLTGGSASTDLFAVPYPNDIRVDASGSIDLAHLKTVATDRPLVATYFDLVAKNELGGFGLNSAAFFRFSAPLDPSCLPQNDADTVRDGASVRWVNIHKGSPEYGKLTPFKVSFSSKKGDYIGENHLAVLPVPGFPLLPRTTYAVLVTEAVCDEEGKRIQADQDFPYLLQERDPGIPALDAARKAYAPLRSYLGDRGVTGVVSAAVFTTGDPVGLMGRARKVVHKLAAPQGTGLEVIYEESTYYALAGTYQAPNFQQGKVPYMTSGGDIKLDANGDPVVAVNETMRFAISVPKGTMPAAGWPVVLYAHGTGGDYMTFVRNDIGDDLSEVKDASGAVLGRMAVVGIDQVLHGERGGGGSSTELSFFNFMNPTAARNNVIQAGIDNFSLLRMVSGLSFTSAKWKKGTQLEGQTVTFPAPVKLDTSKVFFMGHSQGGITGPGFLAHEPGVKGAVLSAAGGVLILTLLEKEDPMPIRPLVEQALGESGVTMFHPVLSLIQQLLEPADPVNYARLMLPSPPSGQDPKHLYLSQGVKDLQTPNATSDALATAAGVPLVGTQVRAVPSLALRGLSPAPAPVSGNLASGGKAVTGGLVQYPAPAAGGTCSASQPCKSGRFCKDGKCYRDGHYVLFDITAANTQMKRFMGTLARDGTPTITKP